MWGMGTEVVERDVIDVEHVELHPFPLRRALFFGWCAVYFVGIAFWSDESRGFTGWGIVLLQNLGWLPPQ